MGRDKIESEIWFIIEFSSILRSELWFTLLGDTTPSMLNSRDNFGMLYKSLDSLILDVWVLAFSSMFGICSCSQTEARPV